MENLNISKKTINKLKNLNIEGDVSLEKIESSLDTIFDKDKSKRTRSNIIEACSISGYRKSDDSISVLVCDDAPQFKQITDHISLCWIHAIRHYKKLVPVYPGHNDILESFMGELWKFYNTLQIFKKNPCSRQKILIEKQFDDMFIEKTGYEDLDERSNKIYKNKKELLLVLNMPYIPLHNNAAEHEVRLEKRKQDISYQTRTDKGTKVKDAGMTIVQTAKKLGVNVYNYFSDRISKTYKMPSLASLITARSLA
jgi:hypothetical protein